MSISTKSCCGQRYKSFNHLCTGANLAPKPTRAPNSLKKAAELTEKLAGKAGKLSNSHSIAHFAQRRMRVFPALPQGRGKISSYGVKFLRFSSLNLQKFALSESYFAHGCCRFFKLFGALEHRSTQAGAIHRRWRPVITKSARSGLSSLYC